MGNSCHPGGPRVIFRRRRKDKYYFNWPGSYTFGNLGPKLVLFVDVPY